MNQNQDYVAGAVAKKTETEDSKASIPMANVMPTFVKWTSIVPAGFARLGTVIPYVSDKIPPETQMCCLGGAIISPSYFFVNPYQTWNDLDEFMKIIQFSYRNVHQGTDGKISSSRPVMLALLPGLYVAVWYKEEWNRARILKRLDETHFSVRLIDFGDTQEVEFGNIRYLMQSLAEFPIQAVRCRLLVKNGRSEEMLKKDYTGVQCTTFFNMIYDRGLAIFFNESKIEGGERIWNVRMQILQGPFNEVGGKMLFGPKEIEAALFVKQRKYHVFAK